MVLRPIRAARVRVYQTLRTAHLERAHELAPAAILFVARRYDFDERLLAGLEVVQAGRWRSAGILARSRVRELEVNEPLMLPATRAAALAMVAARLKAAITGGRVLVVCYAIGNADPRRLAPSRSLRQRLGQRLDLAIGRALWRGLDRVAYGSTAARDVYDGSDAAARRPRVPTHPGVAEPVRLRRRGRPSASARLPGGVRRAEGVPHPPRSVEHGAKGAARCRARPPRQRRTPRDGGAGRCRRPAHRTDRRPDP